MKVPVIRNICIVFPLEEKAVDVSEFTTARQCWDLSDEIAALPESDAAHEILARLEATADFLCGRTVFQRGIGGPFYVREDGETALYGPNGGFMYNVPDDAFSLSRVCSVVGKDFWFREKRGGGQWQAFTITKTADSGKEPVFSWVCGEKSGDFSSEGKKELWKALTDSRYYMSHWQRGEARIKDTSALEIAYPTAKETAQEVADRFAAYATKVNAEFAEKYPATNETATAYVVK